MQEKVEAYQERIAQSEVKSTYHKGRAFKLSIMRLVILLGTFVGLFALGGMPLYIFIAWVIAGIILFVYVVILQKRSDRICKREENNIIINRNEIESLTQFNNLYADGASDDYNKHFYASDLDVFGPISLYGLINRCRTYHGNMYLSKWLSSIDDIEEISLRQSAVQELESAVEWRQKLANELLEVEDHSDNPATAIDALLSQSLDFVASKVLYYYVRLVPFIWLALLAYYFINPTVAERLATLYAVINLLTTFYFGKRVTEVQSKVSSALSYLKTYATCLGTIMRRDIQSDYLAGDIARLKTSGKGSDHSARQLTELRRIIDFLDYRLNMFVGVLLNILLLWDLRIVGQLYTWQQNNSGVSEEIFTLIGKVEAISSLSNWSYNHDQYGYGDLTEDYFNFSAVNMGHPLLALQHNEPNDFTKGTTDYVTIITGSNMSGKSTFLRTIGVNLILAYAGTRTYSKELKSSVVQIVSYMRIKDALEESVSTFKAELNRIDMILGELKKGTKSLILIDEMLRGTNSKDKLKGSIGITKRLLELEAYAIIATHDIQLAEMGTEEPEGIENYFFDIDFQDGDLRFDYKLKKGICENFNASFLISQLGIPMD